MSPVSGQSSQFDELPLSTYVRLFMSHTRGRSVCVWIVVDGNHNRFLRITISILSVLYLFSPFLSFPSRVYIF